MTVFTHCRLANPLGQHQLSIPDYESLDYVLNSSPGGIGVLEILLRLNSGIASYLVEDARLTPWRAIDGRPPYHDNGAVYLIRYLDYSASYVLVRAEHATNLLDRRIIAYNSGTSYTSKSSVAADNMIKAYARQNLGSGIVGADRDGVETYADVSAYLTIAADVTLGPLLNRSAARRQLLDTCVDIANASATAGTYLTFEITAPSENTLELRTYTTQRGIDRRAGTPNAIILSEMRGNLENSHLVIDYTKSATFIVAGGQGEQALRLIGTAFDATRAGSSPFGRLERLHNATTAGTQADVDDEADERLRRYRPVVYGAGDLIETEKLVRGVHYDLGDIVTMEQIPTRLRYDVRLDMIRESINARGHKTTCGVRSLT